MEEDSDDKETVPQLKLDKKSELGFVAFFNSLDLSENCVRFFDRKGYFSVHGNDAAMIAGEYYKTATVIRQLGSASATLASVCVSTAMFSHIARDLLLSRNRKVQVFAQNGAKWAVSKSGSPGNLQAFEEALFANTEMADSPIVLAIRLGGTSMERVIGCAYADVSQRGLGVCEFMDNDQFSTLEAVIVQVGAKECLVCADPSPENAKVNEVLQRCGVALTERKRSDFSTKDIRQDLLRLVVPAHASDDLSDVPTAHGAIAVLVKYLDLLADETNHHGFRINRFDLATHMRLDAAAVRALNLTPAASDPNKRFSLFGLLDVCRTAMGSRLLRVWLRQPLLHPAAIALRLNIVEAFVQDTMLRQALLEDHLKRIPDINRLTKKFVRKRATLQDIVTIYQVVIRLPELRDALMAYEGQHKELLDARYTNPLKQLIQDSAQLETMVESTIDLAQLEQHQYVINPQFDPDLQTLRNQQDVILQKIQRVTEKVAQDLSLEASKLKLENNNQHGYYLRITRKDEKALRSRSGYTVLDTRKDGIKFQNPTLRDLSRQYETLSSEYNSKQAVLAQRAIEIVASYNPVMDELNQLLAELDVLLAFAHASVSAPIPYVRPVITAAGEGNIELIAARHPCMEALDGMQFIPNDVSMQRGTSQFVIITGPNMGGKSTYIRMVGVIVLMAQIGCFVPASTASLCITDCILARVGAGDAMLRGVSTFMAEMLETAAVLRAATEKSLIIIDELGRGTSTYDGFGLAWAISEHISSNIGCMCLFATHFHELTALQQQVSTVTNRHVTAHTTDTSLTLLYRVEDGACDRSFGIHVAELACFPPKVVAAARRKADELEAVPLIQGGGSAHAAKRTKSASGVQEVDDVPRDTLNAARALLNEFAALPLDTLAPAAAAAQARQRLDAAYESNPLLRKMILMQ